MPRGIEQACIDGPLLARACRTLPLWLPYGSYPDGTMLPNPEQFISPIANLEKQPGLEINRKSAIGNRKCFWWTWHDLNVRPRPSQSRALIPLSYRSVAETERVERSRDFSRQVSNLLP